MISARRAPTTLPQETPNERVGGKPAVTDPRFQGHQPVEISTFFGTWEFAGPRDSWANSSGVFHASAVCGRSSL
jgi:hypothetical protein